MLLKRLLGVAVLSAAPLAALLGYQLVDEHRRLHAAVRAEAIERTHAIASEYDRLLAGAHYLLLSVSRRGAIRTGDPDTCRAALIDIVAELQSYAALAAYDLSGRPLCASFALPPNENVANRPFFRRALTSGGFALGNALRNRTSGRLQLPAALPFAGSDGQMAGIVMLLVDLDWITRTVDAIGGTAGPSVVVADREGTVIMQSPPPREMVAGRPLYLPLPPILNDVLGATKPGTVSGPGNDEIRRIWGYSPLGGAPQDLFVAAGIDEAATLGAVFRAVVQSALVSLLFLALGIGTCVIAGWLLLRRHAPEAMIGTFVPPTEAPAVVTRLRSVAQSGSTPDKPRGQSKLQGPD